MYEGNQSRKRTLIEYGFFACPVPRTIGRSSLKSSNRGSGNASTSPQRRRNMSSRNTPKESLVEQIIRPTGLLDPVVTVKKTNGQIDDITAEVKSTIKRGERILITTLTKKMADDLQSS